MTKSIKKQKKSAALFDDDKEFTLHDTAQDEELEATEDLPDDVPPEEMLAEEAPEVADEPLEELDDATDDETPDEESALEKEDEEEASAHETPETKNIVVKCPHCLEEVLDMDVCPLCGNPLKLTADTELTRENFDDTATDEDYVDEGYTKKRKNSGNPIDETDPDVFGGLPYQQDQYSSITSDTNL